MGGVKILERVKSLGSILKDQYVHLLEKVKYLNLGRVLEY